MDGNVEAVLFNAPFADPIADRLRQEKDSVRRIFVPVGDSSTAAATAVDLLKEEQVSRIEVCGALGLRTGAAVLEATGERVPVEVCTFGIESLESALEFDRKITSGNSVSVAMLFVLPGSDPHADSITIERGNVRMLFIPVPRQGVFRVVAENLAKTGSADLVELYCGITKNAAAQVIDAIGATVPVGSTA